MALNSIIFKVIKMSELMFKVDVPPKLEPIFESALKRIVSEFLDELKFSVAREVLSRSELTDEQANRFAEKVKKGIAMRHGVL